MKVSPKGILEIAEHEGVVLGPYLDSVGVWTYGVGHTAAAGGVDPSKMPKVDTRGWTQSQVKRELIYALRLFDDDLDKYEERVNQAVKVPLKQHQYDALVSFDFNTGGIFRANLTKNLNKKNHELATEGFMGWTKPKEIIKRRKAEMMLFATGKYDANGTLITVWDTYGNGKLKWRGTISSRELKSLMKTGGAKREPFVKRIMSFWSFLKKIF